MARNKELYLKDAKTSISASATILDVKSVEDIGVSELRAVVNQLTQASNELNRLIGVIDAESELPKRLIPKNQPIPVKS